MTRAKYVCDSKYIELKKMFQNNVFGVIFLIVFAISACSVPENNENLLDRLLVEQKLQERIDDYMKSRLLSCKLSILEEAEIHVDTLIESLISFDILNGVQFPTPPTRPQFPDRIILDDTTEVRPIFKD